MPQLTKEGGWHCDNEYDDDHVYPFAIPDPVYDDFVTLNADGEIYYQPSGPFEFTITNSTIANENYLDYCLYWAFEQLDANVNALEFDQMDGAYELDFNADSTNNKNIGYDDYTIGAANFATRLSVVFRHGYNTPAEWFMPTDSASSMTDSAQLAFDDDYATYWHSETGDSHWIMIDFGRIRTIQQVYLRFPAEHILSNFYAVYWDSAAWQDFDAPVFDILNTDSIRLFLVEPAPAEKILLFSTDSTAYIAEMQLFGQGFRQFLLKRYCSDSGWTSTDTRWETEKLVNLSDTLQCPDGTINSFNYRKYLQAHDWTLNPFGGELTWENMLDPPNKLFLDWFPHDYYMILTLPFYNDDFMVELANDLFEESFMYESIYLNWWRTVTDSVRSYGASLGRDVFITYNGSAYVSPHYVDYFLAPMGDCLNFPVYHCTTATDTDKVCLIGDQAQINIWRLTKRRATEYLGEDVPLVAFCDFWQLGMPFAHLGGIDEPADERAIYIRVYGMEMRAAGVNFCFPVDEAEENSWTDTLADGTPLIEVIKQQADFLNTHWNIYHHAVVSDYETLVTVNGIVPFNGEWNIDWDSGLQFDSPVNESKVTTAYMNKDDRTKSYLHIINHDWDSLTHQMIPQNNIPVEIPIEDSCIMIRVISPDFAGEDTLPFTYQDSVVSCTIPELAYYDVLILDLFSTGVEESNNLNRIALYQITPNPFRTTTEIRYSIPIQKYVELKIYNLAGQLVKTLVNEQQKARTYIVKWNGRDNKGRSLPSGMYFIRLKVGDEFSPTPLHMETGQAKKLLLLR
ncbi:T9SS type A sorting domain-containing protein [candidate division WOR-3 bacterium]|nr:T9SS type A sorting domain-containing protein [candidate division WOR-3 bacterium]